MPATLTCDGCDQTFMDDLVAFTETVDGSLCEDCAEGYRVCDDCGYRALPSDRYPQFCGPCADRYYSCANCENVVHEDDARVGNGNTYCESCHDQCFTTCDSCCETIVRDDVYLTPEDEEYCESCYSETYASCDSCGRAFELADLNGDGYCESCARPEIPSITPLKFGHPRGNRPIGFAGFRRFGVELETSSCDNAECVDGTPFGCKEDGSTDGPEFYSSPLCGTLGLEAIREFCDDVNADVNGSCGFHLHFDICDMEADELRNICRAYHAFEDVWRSFVPVSRRNNGYCSPLPHWFDQFYNGSADHPDSRYHWLNVRAELAHGTYEIRLHTATLNADKICNWVRAHLLFVEHFRAVQLPDGHTGTFGELCEIWADADLAYFYRDRAAQFGTEYVVPCPLTPVAVEYPVRELSEV